MLHNGEKLHKNSKWGYLVLFYWMSAAFQAPPASNQCNTGYWLAGDLKTLRM
jgi:hypothetical protein